MKWLSISNLTLGDILQWSGTAWRNTPLPVSVAASVVGKAEGATTVTVPSTGLGIVRLDGPSVLHGGATIDNTGVAGNGIKPGTAGTYLIMGQVSINATDGNWLQAAWGLNGVAQKLRMGSGGTVESGGDVIDVATLGATDVVNLMGRADVAAVNYAPGCRLVVVRLW